MQQGCCDMYGLSVEKSMMMRMSPADLMEPMELLERGASPPLSDSGSEHQNRSPPATSCENSSAMEEAKSGGGGSKKRRKQSNPLRYQTSPAPAPMPLLDEALDLQTTRSDDSKQGEEEPPLHRCHHCPGAFESEDHLRVHVEEEHVQKALERQLQQYNKATSNSNREEPAKDSNNSSTPKSDLGMMVVPLEQTRASPPDDYKTPHFPFPPMPPFIPFSRSDDSKPGNMSMPLSMFPNPMAPFLFPVIPQGQTPPASNGTSHSGQGVRIFNLEAYCELCNKEFCNKYFLKTHKANKHGIYSVESIVSSPYGAPYLPTSLNSPIPLPHMLPPAPNSDPLPPRTGLLNMESYCEICQKEFCNKYFLKKHRQKIHGIIEPGQNISPSTTPSQDTKSNSPVMTTCALSLTAAPSFMDKMSEDARDNFSKMDFPSLFNIQSSKAGSNSTPAPSSVGLTTSAACPAVVTSGSAISVSLPSPGGQQGSSNENSVSHVFTPEKLREMGVINADAFCELCCKEFCNKYFLRTHKLNKHGINMPEISPGKQHSGPLPPSSHSQGSHSNEKGDGNYDDSRMSEGLLMDHTQGLAFEGTGTGELSCDFCNRPFSSPYLLKMHKFYTHNIPYIKEEDGQSKPNSPSGEKLNQENKENEFAKPHLPLPLLPTSMLPENNNTPTSLQEDAASQDLQKLQSMIRELNASAGSESSKIVCNLCKLEFDNKYFLRAHMMNEHGVLPNEDGHVPGHNNGEFGQTKMSESDFQRLNFNNSSPTIDSEAYCEICQKEFCSKYFLKTHKQNIHGIPVDMSSTPKKSLVEEVYQIKSIVNNTFSSSLMPMPVSRSLTPNGGGSLTPSQSTPNHPPSLSPISSISSHIPVITSNNSVNLHNSRSSPQCGTVSSGPIISSSTILTNSIGNSILTPSSTHHNSLVPYTNSGHLPSNLSLPKMPPMSHNLSSSSTPTSNLTSIAQMHPHLPSLHHNANAGGGGGNSNPLCSSNPLEKPRNLTGRNYCNICNKELCNKYFMKTHMLKMHGINLDSQPHEAARISTIGGVQCDICQKELCSKYFLKVHKQNTHGIFEEGAGGGKELRELPSFLDKEQPMQGLDLSDPSGRYFSHYPEICPVCNCRFKSIKWLKAHMISDHGNILKENFPHHNSLPDLGSNANNHPHNNNNNNSAGNLNNNGSSLEQSCLCVLCGQGFADKVALHVHLIKDHHSASDELASAGGNSGIKTTSTAGDSSAAASMVPEQVVNGSNGGSSSSSPPPNGTRPPKPHGGGGSRIYHCSFCVYSTRWLSNLYAHEKRHTGVNTEGEKKFVCRVCHRAYRYNHSLQRHFLSHRAAGLSLKDMTAQPLIMSSHSSGQLSLLNRPWNSLFHSSSGKKEGGKKIRRYRCSKCSKKFRSRELCLAHIHAAHGKRPKGAKPFRCRFCGFQTRALNVLRIHINRQHQGELSKEEEEGAAPAPSEGLPPPPPNSPHLPMTFAMPQNPPTAGSFIMQPFLLAQPEGEPPAPRNGTFVPSLVYLPVCQKVSQPMTVAFTLTPA